MSYIVFMKTYIISFAIIATIIVLLIFNVPEATLYFDEKMRILYLGLVGTFVGSGVLYRFRNEPWRETLFNIFGLAAIFLILITGYSYRYDLKKIKNRFMGELNPSEARMGEGGEISVRASEDNHFYITININNVPIRFMIDTGASSIVLSPGDAEKLGLKLSERDFTRVYNTANGKVLGAPVKLNVIEVGTITARDVEASVNGADMEHSLLGMSFLSQVGKVEIEDGVLRISN